MNQKDLEIFASNFAKFVQVNNLTSLSACEITAVAKKIQEISGLRVQKCSTTNVLKNLSKASTPVPAIYKKSSGARRHELWFSTNIEQPINPTSFKLHYRGCV